MYNVRIKTVSGNFTVISFKTFVLNKNRCYLLDWTADVANEHFTCQLPKSFDICYKGTIVVCEAVKLAPLFYLVPLCQAKYL